MAEVGTIYLNAQIAGEKAKVIKDNMNNMMSLIKSMDRTIAELRANGWKGEAATGYESRYSDIKEKCLNQAVKLFEEMHRNLTTYSEEMQRVDRETGSKLRG